MPEFRYQSQLRSWLYRIVTNLALDVVTRKREFAHDEVPESAATPSAERAAEHALLADHMHQAIAVALSVGIGSVPLARQVASGRHVAARYNPGDRVRIGDVEGELLEIGLVSSRIGVGGGRAVDVPNAEFIEVAISVDV